ncbi:MAG: hypothetical protein PSN46_01880 [Gammaproteobacteria bacterium]|nr:hypothetical protein [Gammaproteobacteria bacterium]
MLNVIYLVIGLKLVYLASALWRLPLERGLIKTAALSLALTALGCVVNMPLLIPYVSPYIVIMGHNIGLYIGLPMLTLGLLDWHFHWHWQKATWGRIFLALAALFELLRRAETSLGMMLAEVLGYANNHALLIVAAVMAVMGNYLYLAASPMASASPDTLPK